jgi:hypothetical protein
MPANGIAKYEEHKYDEYLCNRTKNAHLLPAASTEPGAAMPVPWS